MGAPLRVLAIGGTGYVGAPVVRELLRRGHDVTVFHRGETVGDSPTGARYLLGERRDLLSHQDTFRQLRIDVVIDMIAGGKTDMKTVVETLRGIAHRSVVLSSADVYRAYDVFSRREPLPLEPTPLTEEARLRTRLYPFRGTVMPSIPWVNWDEYEKIDVEHEAQSASELPTTILRLPMIYGPGDRDGLKNRFFAYLKRMDDKRPAILLDSGTDRWRGPWGYIDHVAGAIATAVENDYRVCQTYNIADAASPAIGEWVRGLAQTVGWRGELVVADRECPPPNMSGPFNTAQDLVIDSSKIRRDLGCGDFVPQDERLARTSSWELAHPPREIDPQMFNYTAEDEILAACRPISL